MKLRWNEVPRGNTPVTLPVVGSQPPITDADLGMPTDDAAQTKAERFIRAAIGHRLHVEAKAREAARLAAATRIAPGPTVAVEVPDDALALISPTDTLDETDRGIFRELRRVEAMPVPKWMLPAGAA